MLDVEKRRELINHLIGRNNVANAKNISDWYMAEGEGLKDKSLVLLNAMSAWYVGDYVYAAGQYKYFLDHLSEWRPADVDIERMQARLTEFETMETNAPKLECSDQRLKPILHRLLYVYHAVNKPVHVFVAKNEQDYITFYQAHFQGEVHSYSRFGAVGLYGDPNVYWLVFKSNINDLLDDTALTGLCAHEMAHLDIRSKGTIEMPFQRLDQYEPCDQFINERLTDLYTMAHGFAYSLYRNRLATGASCYVLDAEDIKKYILKIEQTEIK